MERSLIPPVTATIQIEWINLAGQRKPQSWEKVVLSYMYTHGHAFHPDGRPRGGCGVSGVWGRFWGGKCRWVEEQAPGSARLGLTSAPPLSSCEDLQTWLSSWAFTFSLSMGSTGAPDSSGGWEDEMEKFVEDYLGNSKCRYTCTIINSFLQSAKYRRKAEKFFFLSHGISLGARSETWDQMLALPETLKEFSVCPC